MHVCYLCVSVSVSVSVCVSVSVSVSVSVFVCVCACARVRVLLCLSLRSYVCPLTQGQLSERPEVGCRRKSATTLEARPSFACESVLPCVRES